MTVRASVQGATFSMRDQPYRGHYLSHYVMFKLCQPEEIVIIQVRGERV